MRWWGEQEFDTTRGHDMTTATITLDDIKARADVRAYIAKAERNMEIIGYTEHGFRHAGIVADRARRILRDLGRDPHTAELAAIAGYLHDIGNVASRVTHGTISVMLAYHILGAMGMAPDDIAEVMAGVGNHEEEYGEPFGDIAAAVTIADKSDVSRTRVRNPSPETFDEHDRINYAAISSAVEAEAAQKLITLRLDLDPALGTIMEYFERFLTRMVASRIAARQLGCQFSIVINGTKLL
jgi:metal-dependent HD superfamily phosphatase/phosphodiesterase